MTDGFVLQLSEPLTEINIVVTGGEGVGKSTLVQRALDLPGLPPTQATQRKITAEAQEYLLRLLEIPSDDVDVDEDDNTVMWPDTIDSKITPRIDGALLLYNVKDKSSLEDIPEMLSECRHHMHPTKTQSRCSIPFPLFVANTDHCPSIRRDRQSRHTAHTHRYQM